MVKDEHNCFEKKHRDVERRVDIQPFPLGATYPSLIYQYLVYYNRIIAREYSFPSNGVSIRHL